MMEGIRQHQDGTPLNNMHDRDRSRNDSTATAVADDHTANRILALDNIETAGESTDRNNSEDQTLDSEQTVKDGTHSRRQKLYIHHRHRKGLSKQFTPHSMLKHLHFPKHHTNDEEKAHHENSSDLERQESAAPSAWQNIVVMLTTFPYWNMAFWSGWCYSIGSALFIVSSCFSWVPLGWPDTEFAGETKYGGPLTFFIGACLYQVGGVMAYLEAINDGCFAGAAMKRLLDGHQDIEKEVLDAKLHTFFGHIVPHHHNHDDNEDEHGNDTNQSGDSQTDLRTLSKKHSHEGVYSHVKDRVERRGAVDQGPSKQGQVREYLTWRWWPTWHALKTYHVFELGYIACAIQLFGVTLYGVTSVVILPGILSSLAPWQKLAAYWVPQVVASCCFIIASVMFTIMAQDKWHVPKYRAVSWWIGIHAQIGSVGFLLISIFGIISLETEAEWAEYQSSLSSIWGSFFYMLSGLFQWYEAINTNVGPVLAFPNNRTPVLLRRNHS